MLLKPSLFFHLKQFAKFDSLPQTITVFTKPHFWDENTPFVQNVKSQHSFHMDTDTAYGEFGFPAWVGLASFLSSK